MSRALLSDTQYRLVMPENTRNLVMDFPCMPWTRGIFLVAIISRERLCRRGRTRRIRSNSRRIVDFSDHVELETLLPLSQSRFSNT